MRCLLRGMPVFDAAAIGKRVRDARVSAGLTQAGLAEAAAISDETVSRIERGAYEPAISTAVALANALGVSLDALTGRPSARRSAGLARPWCGASRSAQRTSTRKR